MRDGSRRGATAEVSPRTPKHDEARQQTWQQTGRPAVASIRGPDSLPELLHAPFLPRLQHDSVLGGTHDLVWIHPHRGANGSLSATVSATPAWELEKELSEFVRYAS